MIALGLIYLVGAFAGLLPRLLQLHRDPNQSVICWFLLVSLGADVLILSLAVKATLIDGIVSILEMTTTQIVMQHMLLVTIVTDWSFYFLTRVAVVDNLCVRRSRRHEVKLTRLHSGGFLCIIHWQ